MSKLSKKHQAFINRAELQTAQRKDVTECCDSNVVFLLKDHYHEFSIDLNTILKCLEFAEKQGAVPELPALWWWQVKSL